MTKRKTLFRRALLKLSALGILAFLVFEIIFNIFTVKRLDSIDYISFNENLSEPYIEFSHDTLHVLREDASECFGNFSRSVTDEMQLLFNNEAMNLGAQPLTNASKESLTFSHLSNFSNLFSSLNIKSALIEPSILYCMITEYNQEILLKRNFNVTNTSKSMNILTYGILEHDVPTLQQKENIDKFRKAGFLPQFVITPVIDWMKEKRTKSEAETFTGHIFYKSLLFTIHVVVFYERGSYLWHAGLESSSKEDIPQKDELLFADYNGAYEKFIFYPLNNEVLSLCNFSIPSNPHYFLLETLSSRFIECNSSRSGNESLYANHPKSHPQLSVEHFKKRTHIVLHQLKSVFHPLLMNLWIWSGTMLGWYRQCDIIPYTTDVDFGAWASEVEDLNRIINLFLNNEHAKIKERMGLLEEALEFNINCHGLRTDVFFLYQTKNGSWCSGHSPRQGYYFRYHYPHFTLCSGDLLGEKVQVPCEAEKVILSEYGPGWRKPVSKWHYESSIKNRGPNKYWDKNLLKHAYAVFN